MRFVLAWLILVALSQSALAQVEVRIDSLPPDCQILWNSPAGPKLVPSPGGVVRLENVRPADQESLHFVLIKPGYRDQAVAVPMRGLQAGARLRWPAQPGTLIRLEPLLVSLTVKASPDDADIYLKEFQSSSHFLGKAGHELHLNLARVGGLGERGQLEFLLRRSGFCDTTISIPANFLQPDKSNIWPVDGGSVGLSPRSWLSPIYVLIVQNPLLSALVCAAALALLSHGGNEVRIRWRRHSEVAHQVVQAGLSPSLLAGHRLGAYRLLRILGEGGMATVYLAVPERSLEHAEMVAVKVLHRVQPQFRSEVQALLRLRHPHIVRIDDWGESQGFLYLVLEYVAGPTLAGFRGAPPGEVVPLLRDTFAAVQFAHQQGFVHSDIKPENVLVTSQGVAKVTDFGLATVIGQGDMEETGGTLGYLAPERLRGHPPSPASDQFALGRVASELLPHTEEILAVCRRMSGNNPAERYPSVEAAWSSLVSALGNFLLATKPM